MTETPEGSPPTGGEPAAPTPPIERRRRSGLRDSLVMAALALLAFAVGFVLFNSWVMPQLIHGTGEVQVPDLANLTFEQAEAALEPTGLVLSRAGERFDPSVPRGFVLTQDPPAGTPVRGRQRVLVTVSLGEEFSSVPELSGESRRSATVLLERAGLRVGAITRAPNDEVGADLVAGSDPPAESVLPRNTAVALLVSTGSGPEEYVMPDYTGREIGGVRRQLEAMGFRVVVPPAAPSVGSIVAQAPPAGSRVTRDAQITLQATSRVIR